ncbi:MAG: glycosyltransferase family 4 protein [Candidatus Hodarchaeota archaeon]
MKILYLNNFNYRRGGSENVFLDEAKVMEAHGHAVHIFAREHVENLPSKYDRYFPKAMFTTSLKPTISGLRNLLQLFYSWEAKRRLASMLQDIRIDVAHAHNIYGRLTTSVLDLLSERNVPILMTLHDYKLICPNYKLMFRGQICEDCKSGKFYMAMRNRCHKDNLIASAIYACETYFNERFQKYRKNVRFLIAPSLFMKAKFIEFDWPEEQIEYVPNFLFLSEFEPQFIPGNYFLYFGRLSSEKGIVTLINAFMKIKSENVKLLIVGEGPIRSQLEELASDDSRILFTGYLSGNILKDTTRNSLAVIVPSEWYENAPISILEALAFGKPVVGSRIGGIPEMIDDGVNGYLFEPPNVDDLREKLELVLSMPHKHISEMGQAARKTVERGYNAELHYERLMEIYYRVLGQG